MARRHGSLVVRGGVVDVEVEILGFELLVGAVGDDGGDRLVDLGQQFGLVLANADGHVGAENVLRVGGDVGDQLVVLALRRAKEAVIGLDRILQRGVQPPGEQIGINLILPGIGNDIHAVGLPIGVGIGFLNGAGLDADRLA